MERNNNIDDPSLTRVLNSAKGSLFGTLLVYEHMERDKFGSPIEFTMLCALLASHHDDTGRWIKIGKCGDEGGWEITLQHQIGDYRVDMLLVDPDMGVKVVIECDGHDYHERTKEQAARDRSRDRALQGLGFLVLRYTGSEIWRDPWKCALDVQEKIQAVKALSTNGAEKPKRPLFDQLRETRKKLLDLF